MRRIFSLILAVSLLVVPVRGETRSGYVALTFDDGPSGRFTERLLDGLQQKNVRATFLVCGYRLEEYPELARRMVSEGHEIGYHGFSHDDMSRMSRKDIGGELIESQALLPPGCKPVFLRPPGGALGDGVRQVAEVRNLSLLLWSVDPEDWAVQDAPLVIRRVLSQVKDGDVVLLHDFQDSSVTAALEIVDQLQKRGFTLVTVSQLAKLRGVKLRPGKIYRSFPQS